MTLLSEAAAQILSWGCKYVVVTRGSNGVAIYSLEEETGELMEHVEAAVPLKVCIFLNGNLEFHYLYYRMG